jgi:hypothetical protein
MVRLLIAYLILGPYLHRGGGAESTVDWAIHRFQVLKISS